MFYMASLERERSLALLPNLRAKRGLKPEESRV
jgi:hypothetical protein